MSIKNLALLTLGISLLSGCSIAPERFDEIMIDKALKRAAFEFDCPPEKLTVIKVDHRSYGVVGCNTKATYIGINGSCHPNMTNEKYVIEGCQIASDTLIKTK